MQALGSSAQQTHTQRSAPASGAHHQHQTKFSVFSRPAYQGSSVARSPVAANAAATTVVAPSAASTQTYVSPAARATLFTPAQERVVEAECKVQGRLPAWLRGSVVANGAGDFSGMRHLFDGFALMNRVRLPGGEQPAVTASQRFIRTEAYTHFKSTGQMKYREFLTPLTTNSPLDYAMSVAGNMMAIVTKQGGFTDNASVNLVPIPAPAGERSSGAEAGRARLLALSESLPSAYTVDGRTGATLGAVKYTDSVAGDLTTAHPKVVRGGQLVNFSRSLPMGGFHVYLQDPATLERKEVAFIPDRDPLNPAWVHDMAATDDYLIICEMPIHFHMPSLMLGGERDYGFMDWRPETGTRVHVVSLDGSRQVRTYSAPAIFTFHFANAFEEVDPATGARRLHVDMAQYDDPQIINDLHLDLLRTYPGNEVSRSYFRRLTLPLSGTPGQVGAPVPLLKDENAYGSFAEFPATNPLYQGKPYRYLYGTAAVRPTNMGNALARHDLQAGTSIVWHEDGGMPGEPVFVPRPGGSAEDDGVLLSLLTTAAGDSAMLCLDARDLTELARVQLPIRVPYRFHGTFVADML